MEVGLDAVPSDLDTPTAACPSQPERPFANAAGAQVQDRWGGAAWTRYDRIIAGETINPWVSSSRAQIGTSGSGNLH